MTELFWRSTDLFRVSLEALASGVRFARNHLLDGDEALDAEAWSREDLPLDEKQRLLLLLRQDTGFTEHELRIHAGDPPIPADRQTHVLVAGILKRGFPSCHVVGEEATEAELDAAEKAGVGALIFSIDAIDGSRPYDTLTFGYSTNLLAYRRIEEGDELLLAIVVNSSELLISFQAPGDVQIGTLDAQRSISEPLSINPRMDTIATVGAKFEDRTKLTHLWGDSTVTLFTTGGAPAALGLVIGRLAALVCASAQSTHDAAYLPILASLGIPIFLRDGTAIALPDVLSYFSHVARVQEGPEDKPVPAFVAGRNIEIAHTLARSLPAEDEPIDP